MRLPDLKIKPVVLLPLIAIALVLEVAIENYGALAFFALTYLLLLLSADVRRAVWRWVPDGSGKGKEIALGLIVGTIIQIVVSFGIDPIVERLFDYKADLSAFAGVEGNIVPAIVLIIIGWLIGGLTEELSNRGMVVGYGSHVLGERWAVPLVLISGVMFGAAHGYQGVGGMIGTGIAGLCFGALYLWRKKTLLAPVIAHGFMDTTGVMLLYFGHGLH